jgi:hypothetical protein
VTQTSRRPGLVPLLAAAVAVLAAALAVSLLAPAIAQTPATDTVVIDGIPVTPINGHATLLLGSNDGVIGANCDGGWPLGGGAFPAIVLEQREPDLTRLRIMSGGLNTPAVNGREVFIACDFEVTVEQTLTQLSQLRRELAADQRTTARRLLRSGQVQR